MGSFRVWLSAASLTLGLCWQYGEAHACGGCFVPPDENTQVTGHRMLMSIGKDQSTLYDQIEYAGSPESFAWVLPVKGKVTIGVSSDLVFNRLGFDSAVAVAPPPLDCPVSSCAAADGGFGTPSRGAGEGASDSGVQVVAQEVVGPYETVQLASTDPKALGKWLGDHGYKIPEDIGSLIATYVAEGFNFLAVKLVPGKGVQSMQPIRITSKGPSVALPLRMVAAGTGALTTISLYVLSEFRAETANFPGFVVDPAKVVWNYGEDRSNYTQLRAAGYDASKGFGWLTESAQAYSPTAFRNQVASVIELVGPAESGYGEDLETVKAAAQQDMEVLFAGMEENEVWLTRLRAELPREALSKDLVLQAALNQVEVPRFIQTTQFIGQKPACPPLPPGCEEVDGDGSLVGRKPSEVVGAVRATGGGGCSFATRPLSEAAFDGAALALGVALYGRRRRRR